MRPETAQILALLDGYTLDNVDDIAMSLARDFRNRRVEKRITRRQLASDSGVAISNIARFEQKGLISLKNLVSLALTIGYLAEVKSIFSEPKFSTIEELGQIRANAGKTKAYPKRSTRR